MAAEDRNAEVSTQGERTASTTRERTFDAVARGVANGTVSRRKALHLLAVGLVGSALGFTPSVASAAPATGVTKCKPLAQKCLTNIDCCSRFCDKNGNQCACSPEEIACMDPSSGHLKCVPRCAGGLGPCKIDACNPVTGGCVVANAPDNVTPCETGNLCTADFCENGTCKQGLVNVTCPDEQCQKCNPSRGACEPVTNGTRCNADNNACTENDACQAGLCVPGPVKICPESTNPCATLVCDPTTGNCEPQPANAGAVCRKASGPCELDAVCTGTSIECPDNEFRPPAFMCRDALDECDLPAFCTGNSAQCPNNPFRPAGFVCLKERGPCEAAGTCTGSSAQCRERVFLPTTEECRPSQGPCDLPEFCTGGDFECPPNLFRPAGFVCLKERGPCEAAGTCTGTTAQCRERVFLPSTEVCREAANQCDLPEFCTGGDFECPPNLFRPRGAPCETGNKCTADICNGQGGCEQGPQTVTCPQCQICDPQSGTCKANPLADGTKCEDGDLCTVGDTCQNGTCQPGTVTTCPDTGNPCTVSVCNKSTGTCNVENRPNDTKCNDNNPCTENDVCTEGVCAGTQITGCVRCNTASDCATTQCQQAACTGGVCVITNKPNNTTCNDTNPCTTNDRCQDGVCTGTAVTCPSGQICCPAGSPGTVAGTCRRARGTACNNNNQCCSGSCPGSGSNRVCA